MPSAVIGGPAVDADCVYLWRGAVLPGVPDIVIVSESKFVSYSKTQLIQFMKETA